MDKLKLVISDSGLKDFSQYKLNLGFENKEGGRIEKDDSEGRKRHLKNRGKGDNQPYKRQLAHLRRVFG